MVKFGEDTKKQLGNYFGEGTHKVTITKIEQGKTQDEKEYFEFTVEGENGEEGTARVFWTEKAQQYSFNSIRDIFVHNTPEKNREAVRAAVDNTTDTDELFKLCQQTLIGKEAWYVVQKTDRTYTNAAGELKYSYNRNLYGYEYHPKPAQKTSEELINELTGGEQTDINAIPFN